MHTYTNIQTLVWFHNLLLCRRKWFNRVHNLRCNDIEKLVSASLFLYGPWDCFPSSHIQANRATVQDVECSVYVRLLKQMLQYIFSTWPRVCRYMVLHIDNYVAFCHLNAVYKFDVYSDVEGRLSELLYTICSHSMSGPGELGSVWLSGVRFCMCLCMHLLVVEGFGWLPEVVTYLWINQVCFQPEYIQ